MMGTALRYGSLILLLVTVSVSLVVHGDEIKPQTRAALVDQLQILRLYDPSFNRDYEQASQMSTAELVASLPMLAQRVQAFWSRHGLRLPYASLSDNASLSTRIIALEPKVPDYLNVLSRVRYLMWLADHHTMPEIALDGWLRPGDSHPAITAIEQRLSLLGDLRTTARQITQYDEVLAQAVKHFQKRHGLKEDAVIGPNTLRWLQVSPEARARLLVKNFLEKSELLAKLGDRYLIVNIPAFELVLVDDAKIQLKSKVIVGKTARQTPLLHGEISNVIMNPTWRVPRRILRQDLVPQIRKNGEYLQDRNFEVFDFDGNLINMSDQEWQSEALGKFPYRLVQKPGKDNALGKFKFHFANDFDIYLHDTPDVELFQKDNRALSSGCIRVEKVDELAAWFADHLVKDKRTWNKLLTNEAKTQWFSLNETLPVYLVYWTAWVDEQHVAQFRSDVYGLEAPNELSTKYDNQFRH